MIKALLPAAQASGLLSGPGDTVTISGAGGAASAGALGGGVQHHPGHAGEAGGGGLPAPALPAIPYEQQITNARARVNQDPKRVAQVVKNWVSVDE